MRNPGPEEYGNFSTPDAKRIWEMLKAWEREPRNAPKFRDRRENDQGIRFGVVTTEITAFNASTKVLGIGKVKLQYRNAADRKLTDYPGPLIVDAENDIVGTVAVGRQVVVQFIDGTWVIMKAGCA
jgi:hypothetical protein